VLALAYHAIADLRHDRLLADYAVPPDRFAAQLEGLLDEGWEFLGLDRVRAGLEGRETLPARSLLLTFDDAYADLLEVACPILRRLGAPGVVFVVADEIGGSNVWDQEKGSACLSLLDAGQLGRVAAAGIEIGSHTASHSILPQVADDQLERELVGAADAIEAAGVPRPRAFSYPYGEWSAGVAEAVAAAGYDVAFTIQPGTIGPRSPRLALPRVEVNASDDLDALKRKLRAARMPRPLGRAYLRSMHRRAHA
jgi:peptidoglycan/xylan/chitin deacetylase (PgdA/CDA1 family)